MREQTNILHKIREVNGQKIALIGSTIVSYKILAVV